MALRYSSYLMIHYRMNSLLLADELREIVVNEALGLKDPLPNDYVWPPLDYATCNDDDDQKPIQKIGDLKKKKFPLFYNALFPSAHEEAYKRSAHFFKCFFIRSLMHFALFLFFSVSVILFFPILFSFMDLFFELPLFFFLSFFSAINP